MLRAGIFALIFGAAAMAADWTEYKDGPFRVISNAGDGDARKILTEMEQLRFVLGGMLGKDTLRREELDATWPIVLVLFDSDKDRAAYALPAPFVEGGSANLSTTPSPAWRSAIALQLIEANAGRMPENIETALVDLFSTIEVRTTRVAIGAPVKGLPAARHREWAKLHMIATRPEFAGRFRVYLKNLQGGDPDLAAFNTFNLKKEELEKRMNEYADKGAFEAVEVFGEAITPSKEFYERRMPQAEVDALLAEVKAAGKSFPPDSARGLAKQNTRESLYAAMAANPKWAAPHAQIAALFADPKSKVAPLTKATQLEPRNSGYWEALARAQSDAGMFIEASKSWISAERAAGTDQEKARLHAERTKIENQRVDAEMAAAREAKDEQERELRRVMAESAARIKAAQDKANRENGAQATFTSGQTVKFGDLNNGTRVAGRLISVECVDSIFKLDIQGTNSTITTVLIRKNPEVDGKPVFACGPVDPARRIEVAHNNKADVRWNTVGEVETYELK